MADHPSQSQYVKAMSIELETLTDHYQQSGLSGVMHSHLYTGSYHIRSLRQYIGEIHQGNNNVVQDGLAHVDFHRSPFLPRLA